MTIKDAKAQNLCIGCVWRLIGPGPMQCMGASVGETECPGRLGREGMKGKEQNR